MRVDLAGLARNAADEIDRLSGDGAYGLRVLARHARETRRGEHAVGAFAAFYYLAEPAAMVLTEADHYPEG